MYTSPDPKMTISPDSSTLVLIDGYNLSAALIDAVNFGRSWGENGSNMEESGVDESEYYIPTVVFEDDDDPEDVEVATGACVVAAAFTFSSVFFATSFTLT
jgi:hypothetical protein